MGLSLDRGILTSIGVTHTDGSQRRQCLPLVEVSVARI
ncbi:uncharacterized protein G2W53_028497 [Senna tora]|uniref:Uncharacterized protein n=1 Tax=Senna tora TaxID=362788 RepID=A0A834T3H2_9FABA|nr:uncharacterized protein G2W53_028497 [Senna tora]